MTKRERRYSQKHWNDSNYSVVLEQVVASRLYPVGALRELVVSELQLNYIKNNDASVKVLSERKL